MLYTAGNFLELNNDSMNDSRWLRQGVHRPVHACSLCTRSPVYLTSLSLCMQSPVYLTSFSLSACNLPYVSPLSLFLHAGVGNALVKTLFTDPALQPAAPAKKGFISVGAKFSSDLSELISTLKVWMHFLLLSSRYPFFPSKHLKA